MEPLVFHLQLQKAKMMERLSTGWFVWQVYNFYIEPWQAQHPPNTGGFEEWQIKEWG